MNPSAREPTCDGEFVEPPVGLIGRVAGYEVSQSDGGEGDEAVVQGVEEVPLRLQPRERKRRQDQDQQTYSSHHHTKVHHADVEGLE